MHVCLTMCFRSILSNTADDAISKHVMSNWHSANFKREAIRLKEMENIISKVTVNKKESKFLFYYRKNINIH